MEKKTKAAERNESKAAKIAEVCNCGNTHDAWYDDFKICALDAMKWKDEQFKELAMWLVGELVEDYVDVDKREDAMKYFKADLEYNLFGKE